MLKDAVPVARLARALIIKLRHHGDVLLASPVLSALKAQNPQLEVDALVYDDTAPMLEGHPALNQLHTVGRGWRKASPFARIGFEWRLFSRLRSRHFDLIVHLTEHPRGAWLARTLGAHWAVAPAVSGRSDFWGRSFTHLYPLPRNGGRHQVELNLDALRRIGLQPAGDQKRTRIDAGIDAEHRVSAVLERSGIPAGQFVHMHPASRWKFKCWPAKKNAELIDRLAARGERIVLTAAPDPEERQLVEDILAHTTAPCVNLAGQLSVKELVAVIARAKISICVDSMPMHVASAVGTPVVALFGPSGEVEWGPWNVASKVVTSNHACRPCGNDGCGGGKVSDCLTTLDVSRVFAAAERLIECRERGLDTRRIDC